MLSVKFQAPILIDEKNLAALLALTGVPAMVEPLVNGAAPKRGRKPREAAAPAEPAPAAAPEAGQQASPQPEAPVKARRGRKPKAQADAAPAAPAPEPEPSPKRGRKPRAEAAPAGPSPDADELLRRFSALIDKDFDAAKSLLDQFGVERFSDMKASEYPTFADKLTEAGV